jgi:uncharacterized membrane protein
MADRNLVIILWICAAVLILFFGMSMSMDGTFMGGMNMGWMMAIPLLVLGVAIYFAYRYGRMAERIDQQKPKP